MSGSVPSTEIEPTRAAEAVGSWLDQYLEDAGADGYVLGVSGGLDSAVAATLAARAVGPDRVLGLVMPGEPSDPGNMADARELCSDLEIDWAEIDITPIVTAVAAATPSELDTLALGNVRARARMVLWYAEANATDRLVIGPDNRSELLLGYFTKYGDGGVDVSPLGDLYKTEVIEVARALDVHDRFIEKTPTAELWAGQTDVEEIGATYDVVDAVLRNVVDRGRSIAETVSATEIDEETVKRLVSLHRSSEHKRSPPPTPGLRR